MTDLCTLERDALLGRWSSGRAIVLLTGFFDESGEHGPDGGLRRLTLGGFFAPWGKVQALCEKWREALAAESLNEFHMKEIASDEHAYDRWPQARQFRLDRFVTLLTDCAEEFGSFSYAVDPNRQAFSDTYETALGRVLITAASLAERTGEKVELVFAYTPEISGNRIGEYFDNPHWADWLAGYRVARSNLMPPLQAAEIVARGLKTLMATGQIMPSFAKVIETGKPFRVWPENPALASIGWRSRRDGERPA